MIGRAKEHLIAAMGKEFYAFGLAHSRKPGDWSNGAAVTLGHLAFDVNGKVSDKFAGMHPREFGQWLQAAWKTDKNALLASAQSAWKERNLRDPDYPIFAEVIAGALGRPFGFHKTGLSDAVKNGLAADRKEAAKEFSGVAGLDSRLVALTIQAAWFAAWDSLRLSQTNAGTRPLTEAERFEARRLADKAAIAAAKAVRLGKIAARKAG